LSWSPDDAFIASYSSKKDKIYLINVVTGEIKSLIEGNEYSNASVPTWSNDSQNIYFSSDRSGEFDIYKINLFDKEVKRKTDNGVRIAFFNQPEKYYFVKHNSMGLWSSNLDNTHQELIIKNFDIKDYQTLSFNNNKIYFKDSIDQFLKYYSIKDKVVSNLELSSKVQKINELSLSKDAKEFVYSDIIINTSKIYLLRQSTN